MALQEGTTPQGNSPPPPNLSVVLKKTYAPDLSDVTLIGSNGIPILTTPLPQRGKNESPEHFWDRTGLMPKDPEENHPSQKLVKRRWKKLGINNRQPPILIFDGRHPTTTPEK